MFCPNCRFNFMTGQGNPQCDHPGACEYGAEARSHVVNLQAWVAAHPRWRGSRQRPRVLGHPSRGGRAPRLASAPAHDRVDHLRGQRSGDRHEQHVRAGERGELGLDPAGGADAGDRDRELAAGDEGDPRTEPPPRLDAPAPRAPPPRQHLRRGGDDPEQHRHPDDRRDRPGSIDRPKNTKKIAANRSRNGPSRSWARSAAGPESISPTRNAPTAAEMPTSSERPATRNVIPSDREHERLVRSVEQRVAHDVTPPLRDDQQRGSRRPARPPSVRTLPRRRHRSRARR